MTGYQSARRAREDCLSPVAPRSLFPCLLIHTLNQDVQQSEPTVPKPQSGYNYCISSLVFKYIFLSLRFSVLKMMPSPSFNAPMNSATFLLLTSSDSYCELFFLTYLTLSSCTNFFAPSSAFSFPSTPCVLGPKETPPQTLSCELYTTPVKLTQARQAWPWILFL